jgi:membrane associated rhomboid family serine protease
MSKALKSSMLIPLIIWAVFLLNFLLWGIELRMFGIHPRTSLGLLGIVFAPFLHAGWQHIIANTIPLLILLPLLYIFYENIKYRVILFSILIGGFAVWLIGKSGTVHIGASGLVFSLMAFLIAAGIFRFSWKSFLIALGVLILYGGAMLQGVLPEEGISWEGHLFGALAGIFLAWAFRKQIRK